MILAQILQNETLCPGDGSCWAGPVTSGGIYYIIPILLIFLMIIAATSISLILLLPMHEGDSS